VFDERAAAAAASRSREARGITSPLLAPPWNRTVRAPLTRLPEEACDSHLHIIGPQREFPLLPSPFNFLAFEDSTVEDWLTVRDALGLFRGVHVQSFMYGDDHRHLLHTLAQSGGSLRGIAVLSPSVTDAELDELESAGVVGARFSPTVQPVIDERLASRLAERGWSLSYSIDPGTDVGWRDAILRRPGRFLLEHLGLPATREGPDGAQFRFALECLDTGRCWVKMSTRASDDECPPFGDLAPLVETVLGRAPGRVLWGSDWPHVPYFRAMPDEADFLDAFRAWISDDGLRSRVFAENPAEIFNWPCPSTLYSPSR